MRLLLVEDDAPLRRQLLERLNAEGYAVDEAPDGREALFLGRETPYDLAIVDLGLPELDGVSLIRQWRTAQRDFPILVLTARGAWQDKVEGLEAGADDYLTKPFHTEELLARLHALVRRAAGRGSSLIEGGPLTIDTAAREVRLHGEPVALTGYEYQTLAHLALHRDQVVSKTELTEHLYAQDFDRDSNVIEVFIRRLRRKLDPDGELGLITTRRGLGYCLRLPDDGAEP